MKMTEDLTTDPNELIETTCPVCTKMMEGCDCLQCPKCGGCGSEVEDGVVKMSGCGSMPIEFFVEYVLAGPFVVEEVTNG